MDVIFYQVNFVAPVFSKKIKKINNNMQKMTIY
jgi:hypothetical protein